MKATKVMLAGVITFLITWCVLGLIGYLLSNNMSYKECMRNDITIFIMFALGWIPSIIVSIDFNDKD